MKKVFATLVPVFLFVSFFAFATEKIDINTAPLEQLDKITGVGPVLAQRIIEARPFSSVDDLLRVKGIGEKTLQKIKGQGLACVGCEPTEEISNNQFPISNEISTPNSEIQNATPIVYPGGILINEILPSPEGADETNEWIELYNSNNFEVDLSDWKIKDKEGSIINYVLPKNTKISAGGYLVLKRPETKIILNNTTDGLFLYWPNEEVVDSMSYEKAPRNQSYNNTGAGWQWSTTLTPGTKNIITQNKTEKETGALLKPKKSGNGKEVDRGLGAISKFPTTSRVIDESGTELKSANPWFLFLTAVIITIVSAIIVLFVKSKFLKKTE
jgi:competence ComEA-like helix-hairpin-helix protein